MIFVTKLKKTFPLQKLMVSTSRPISGPISNPNSGPISQPKCYKICVLKNKCVLKNLAIEHWFYENASQNDHLLLLWRNEPCVVIGRHQNPWVECNIDYARNHGIPVVRRQSGGGTVYHDLGNLNCTFLTPRPDYNKRGNLDMIVKALSEEWNLDVCISPRDDILLNNHYKISGSASKLGSRVAYHHFTLLFNADIERLQRVLDSDNVGIVSNATNSVPSRVKCLSEIDSRINYTNLLNTIKHQFQSQHSLSADDVIELDSDNLTSFHGHAEIHSDLESWKWRFGKTPKFAVKWNFPVNYGGEDYELTVEFTVVAGSIKDFNNYIRCVQSGAIINSNQILPFIEGMQLSKNGYDSIYKKQKTYSKYNTQSLDGAAWRVMDKIKTMLID